MISKQLEAFLNLLDESLIRHGSEYREMKKKEDETQDILHIMELEKPKYKERMKIYTWLTEVRRNRRKAKDIWEESQPLVEFMSDQRNAGTINRLRQTLGEVRKVEKRHENRQYKKKVQE